MFYRDYLTLIEQQNKKSQLKKSPGTKHFKKLSEIYKITNNPDFTANSILSFSVQ
jgi:hypothetical protein